MASSGDIDYIQVAPKFPVRWPTLAFETTLDKIGDFVKLKSSLFLFEGKYPVVDQGEKFISGYVSDRALLYTGDLPVVIFGDHTRVIKFIDFEFAVGADGTKIFKPIPSIDCRFFYYFLQSLRIPSLGYSRHYKILRQLQVPVPPILEQKRIVAKLDSLFAHLDQLRARLEKIPVLLKQFRQAVLTQAVTGKLTETSGRNNDVWVTQNISSLCDHTLGKMLDANKNKGLPTPYLRNVNVRWGGFDLADVSHMKATEEDKRRFSIQDGDILVCEGGEPGRCAVWNNGDNDFIFQKALHRLRCKENVMPLWIVFNLQRDANIGALEEHFTGTTIKHFTLRALGLYTITVPPIQEQQELIRKAESLFAVADRIEAHYQALREKIDQLPQAILSKAFRGELVAQEVLDELNQYASQSEELSLAAEIEPAYKTKRPKLSKT